MSLFSGTQIKSTYVMNGFSNDITGYKTLLGKGVYNQNHYLYNVIPIADSHDYVAGSENGSAGYQNVYRTDSPIGEEWYSVILRNTQWIAAKGNEKFIALDCARCLTVSFDNQTLATTTVTITGCDNNFKPMIEKKQILLGEDFVTLSKSFLLVKNVYFSVDPLVEVSIGTSNVFGIPHFVPYVNYVHRITWNGTDLNKNVFTPGYNWRNTSNTDTDANYNQPTGYSVDAKGVVDLSGQTDPNGSRMLSVYYYIYGTDSELYAQSENSVDNNGSKVDYETPIYQLPIRKNSSNTAYVLPYLVEQDLTGAQYPGDSVFMTKYRYNLAT